MQNSWVVLVPPLLVVLLAATTRRVFFSLFTGIFSSLLIAYDFSISKALPELFLRIWKTTELGNLTSWAGFWGCWYLFIVLFLLLLGILITVLRVSGGAYAYSKMVMNSLKNARSAEVSSLLLSLLFFIDDYFGCLTVGSVMQSITDKFKIPRVKLGLLVNTMAAPLVVLLPVSSWVAEIMMQMKQSGIAASAQSGVLIIGDPLYLYTQMIPFIFYSFIIIISVWYMVLKRVSFGIVAQHEAIAIKTGNLFAGKTPSACGLKPLSPEVIKSSSIIDFLLPIGTLFVTVAVGVLYFGNYTLFGGKNSLLLALQHTQIAAALFVGAAITLCVTVIFLALRKKIALKNVPSMCVEGLGLMGTSVCVLILIWTLSTLIKVDLQTGHYLAHLLLGSVSIKLLPVMFFLVGALTASSMGSAWGTLGILIPIGVPMLVSMTVGSHGAVLASELPMLMPLLGAIVSGAVVGNHMSPISDTMLMSSTSSGAYHIDLVRAQLGLTVPTIASAAVGFLLAGFLVSHVSVMANVFISAGAGLVINIVLLHVLQAMSKNK